MGWEVHTAIEESSGSLKKMTKLAPSPGVTSPGDICLMPTTCITEIRRGES